MLYFKNMKKQILVMLVCLMALAATAKNLKTLRVTTDPQMSCANCENKIKKNIRFEKGVQNITTDLNGQVVTIEYDADKTNEADIINAFDKIKYKAIKLEDADTVARPDSCSSCCGENALKN